MKKGSILVVILLVCALIVVGCGTTAPATIAPAIPTPPVTASSPAAVAPATTQPAAKPTVSSPSASIPAGNPSPISATSPRYGGVLREIEAAGPGSPIGYPAESSGGGNQFALQPLIKEQLGGTFAPCLATSYDINTDLKNSSITFQLRKGVKFQDGTDFNAQAVKWNIDKVIAVGLNKGSTDPWKSVDVLDDYSFRINFTSWSNRNIRTFSSGVVFMVSPTAFQKNGIDWMRWHMVGTGPLTQIDFQRDVSLTYNKNPTYWEQGKPYLDGLQEIFVSDEMTRVALFKSGGAEFLNLADNGRLSKDLGSLGFKILSYQAGATVLTPDSANADSPWSNLKVRQAAEYAIDKESIVNAFGYGYWKSANQLNSSANMAYDPAIEGRKYDVAKAKQLLTEAGYPNGFKTQLIAQNTFNRDIVVAIQSYLTKVGIQADLVLPEAAKFADYMQGNWKNGVVLSTLQEWANPNNQLTYYWGIPATYFKTTSKPDGWADMVNASLTTKAPDQVAVQKAERLAYDYALAIPVYCGATLWALTDRTQDTGLGTRGNAAWWEPQNAWLSK